MTREEKNTLVQDLVTKLSSTNYFYITNTSGLSVSQINDFRRRCFNNGIEYKVVKNTLIRKALDQLEADYSEFYGDALKGSSGIMFEKETANAPAKVIKDFRTKNKEERPVLKGAYIDSSIYLGNEQLEVLSALKSKEELIGEVITLLQSPAKNVISALLGQGKKIAGILKTLSEK